MSLARPLVRVLSVAIACLAMTATTAFGASVTIAASKDNTLFSEDGTLSNGSGERLFTGRTDMGALRRALIAFDVTAVVPAGSTINMVALTMNMNRTRAGDESVSLHKLTADWGEAGSDAGGQEGAGAPAQTGDATWTHRFFATDMWSPAGGEFVSTASDTQTVGGNGDYMWMSAQMATDVQDWLDNPSQNFGWIVIGNEAVNKTAKRFDSHESGSTGPMLFIDFTAPAAIGACCLTDGSCVETGQTECANLGGTYQGDGTSCTPSPCPDPVGACCLPDGSCVEDTEGNCIAMGGTWNGGGTLCADVDCPVVLAPFVDALPIPSPATPVSGSVGGAATYDIAIQQFQQQLHRDLPATTLWGYGAQTPQTAGMTVATYPGPTIEARTGQPVTVNWINDLRDEFGNLRVDHLLDVDLCPHGAEDAPKTVVHLHGGHVPAIFDGYPEATFLPGNQETYIYPNNQDASTLWYHDHALGITRLNVYAGLAGLYIIRDDNEDSLGLPSGEFEIPLVIQDRSFNSDGSLFYPSAWGETFFGDVNLVNGKVWPFLNVKQAKYRFRVLNGANSRTYTLAFDNGMSFDIIGTEGGLLEAPVTRTQITLGPAERFDILVDFSGMAAGTEIQLVNSAPAPFPGEPGVGVIPEVMKFIVTSDTGPAPAAPPTLRTIEALQEADAVEFRTLELFKTDDPCTGFEWSINGLAWDDITERPLINTTEVWSFVNPTGVMHPMHMHLVFFQVLDRQFFDQVDGQIVPIGDPAPPAPEEAGWKDTVQVAPNEIVRVIARFENYKGLFAYHCHILEHEDHEMMRQFEVLLPCPGDLNASGNVDGADLGLLLQAWDPAGPSGSNADFNGDGKVDGADLGLLLQGWGPCP